MTNATDPPPHLAPDTARALAADLQRITQAVLAVLDNDAVTTGPVAAVTGHLGCTLREVVDVTAEFRPEPGQHRRLPGRPIGPF